MRARASSPSSKPAGTTASWWKSRACWTRSAAPCACSTCRMSRITSSVSAAIPRPNCSIASACPAASNSTPWPMRFPASNTILKPCATSAAAATKSSRSPATAWRPCVTGRCRWKANRPRRRSSTTSSRTPTSNCWTARTRCRAPCMARRCCRHPSQTPRCMQKTHKPLRRPSQQMQAKRMPRCPCSARSPHRRGRCRSPRGALISTTRKSTTKSARSSSRNSVKRSPTSTP